MQEAICNAEAGQEQRGRLCQVAHFVGDDLYEAVHKLGMRRVVFASTNHTMGM